MADRYKPEMLLALTRPPADNKPAWYSRAQDSVGFVTDNAQSDVIVLYANLPNVLMQAVLAPLDLLDPVPHDDIKDNYIDPSTCWGLEHSSGGPTNERRMYLSPPLASCGSKTLAKGQKLIFVRRFIGVQIGQAPIELSQKLVHSLDLHYDPARNAYCRLDGRGAIEPVIAVKETAATPDYQGGVVVTILSKDLMKYMAVAAMGLVTKFDFTRYPPDSFGGFQDDQRHIEEQADLCYEVGVMEGHASFANGHLVTRPNVTVAELIAAEVKEGDPKTRQYATFIAEDRKNGTVIETSCAPDAMVNYFDLRSPLPWHISPVFFDPEVLSRYKSDPARYDLDDRSIKCRGSWSLKTYDINEAGQVHT